MSNYFWSTTGNDGNPGTQISPKRNMSAVLALLGPGDVGYGRGGTYQEWSDNAVPGGNSWNDPVTVAAFPGEPVTLQPNVGANFCFVFQGAATKYIVIDGFTLDAVNALYDVVKVTEVSGITTHAHHIRIQNSELKNSRNNGVLVGGDSIIGGNEFINLHVHHNGNFDFNPHGYGFYIAGANNLIERCRIHDDHAVLGGSNSGGGIQLYNSNDAAAVHDNIIRKCLIYDEQYGGVIITRGRGNFFYNNIVHHCKSGVVVDYSAILTYILSNTVYNCSDYSGIGAGYDPGGMLIGPGADQTIFKNNIGYLNSINYRNLGSSTDQSNNLTDGTNPLFVDAGNADFRLQGGSPAINAGADLSAYFTDDYNGFVRG